MRQRRITSVAEGLCIVLIVKGAAMKAKMLQWQAILKPWQSPNLVIYGDVDMLTAKRKDEPPPGKCAGGNDVWTMWGHGTPHCGALS